MIPACREHGDVVLGECFGEDVGAVASRHEVEILRFGRVEGGEDGRLPWITNGVGGKALDPVGIVRGGSQEVFLL